MPGSSPDKDRPPDPDRLFEASAMTVEAFAQLYGVPPAILRRAIGRGELALVPAEDGAELLERAAVVAWLKRRHAGWA